MNGLIVSYDDNRRYGFIQPLIGKPDTTENIFFHVSAVRNRMVLPKGTEVEFIVVRGNKGKQAADVRPVVVRF